MDDRVKLLVRECFLSYFFKNFFVYVLVRTFSVNQNQDVKVRGAGNISDMHLKV